MIINFIKILSPKGHLIKTKIKLNHQWIDLNSVLSISLGKEDLYGFRVAYEKSSKGFFGKISTQVVTEFINHSSNINEVRAAIKILGEEFDFFRIGDNYLVNLHSVTGVCEKIRGCLQNKVRQFLGEAGRL